MKKRAVHHVGGGYETLCGKFKSEFPFVSVLSLFPKLVTKTAKKVTCRNCQKRLK